MKSISNDLIIKKLQEKGATLPCARCNHNQFSLVSQTVISIQSDPSTFQIGGKSIPAVIVACDNCGNLNTHAIGALGLLEVVE